MLRIAVTAVLSLQRFWVRHESLGEVSKNFRDQLAVGSRSKRKVVSNARLTPVASFTLSTVQVLKVRVCAHVILCNNGQSELSV